MLNYLLSILKGLFKKTYDVILTTLVKRPPNFLLIVENSFYTLASKKPLQRMVYVYMWRRAIGSSPETKPEVMVPL